MGRILLKFFLIILFLITLGTLALSYFGLETNRFDNIIKSKTNEINKNVRFDFNKTKIHLNIKELNLVIKLQNPKILVKKNEIKLSTFDIYLSIRSFYTSDFLIEKTIISFEKNNIKDITKVTSIFIPRIINKQLDKIFSKGTIEGQILIPFNDDGKISNNYEFKGKIINSTINFGKDYEINNLTTEISYSDKSINEGFVVKIKKGNLFDLDLDNSTVNLKITEKYKRIKSELYTKGLVNSAKIKKFASLFKINLNQYNKINGKINLKTNINFNLNNNFKIKDLNYLVEGNLEKLEIETKKNEKIKKYLPEYNSKINFKDVVIKIKQSKPNQSATLKGFFKIGDKFDTFSIDQNFNYNTKAFNIKGNIDLTSYLIIPNLNYTKNNEKKSEIIFNIKSILDKNYNIESLTFLEDKTKIYISNIKLNKNLQIDDFSKINVKTFSSGTKNNDFVVERKKEIKILGKVFDAKPILQSLYKKSSKKTLSKKFKSKIKINFDKTLTGTGDDVSNFALIANINKGSFNKLNLKGSFSETEIVELSIYQINENKKTFHLISDRARPFIKHFDFIKGFEGGKLEYVSIIEKGKDSSNLSIINFKVSEVPALAKLLTLASLQGIADTLSGEGIRFDSFEMKSNSDKDILNIEEALATGPAVSILLDGYVDKGKTVSLRGTLVPATKLNSIIASIPVVGDILVGKKSGDGVVGVSFKMKGPPKNIKTTVNPIKTLTPRFILRALEKIKNKEKTK